MRVLITGINGMDGSYLAELMLAEGHEVWGTIRRNSVSENQTTRINHILPKITRRYADLLDFPSIHKVIAECDPHEIYHVAAQSHVRVSFDVPSYTMNTIIQGTLNIFESVKLVDKYIRIYNAGSSEMFGNSVDSDGFSRETTPMNPVSPYGIAKHAAFNLGKMYRDSYDMFICNGILFNHEADRRGANFVTAKIVNGAYDIAQGKADTLNLGNLQASRDWGHAKDYCKGMHLMLGQEVPGDYVLASGETHTVEYFADLVFRKFGLDYQDYVKIAPEYFRPNELHSLKGDASKARSDLGWSPEYSFEGLVDDMIEHKNNEKN